MIFRAEVRSLLPRLRSLQGNARRGRSGFASDFSVQSPEETRKELLTIHQLGKLGQEKQHSHIRAKRQGSYIKYDRNPRTVTVIFEFIDKLCYLRNTDHILFVYSI